MSGGRVECDPEDSQGRIETRPVTLVRPVRYTQRDVRHAAVGAGLDIDAFEQLAAEFAPGLHRAHLLIFSATANAGAALKLCFGQVSEQFDRLTRETVST